MTDPLQIVVTQLVEPPERSAVNWLALDSGQIIAFEQPLQGCTLLRERSRRGRRGSSRSRRDRTQRQYTADRPRAKREPGEDARKRIHEANAIHQLWRSGSQRPSLTSKHEQAVA